MATPQIAKVVVVRIVHCRTQPWHLGAWGYWRRRRCRRPQTITLSIEIGRHLHDKDISHTMHRCHWVFMNTIGQHSAVCSSDHICCDLARHVRMHNNMRVLQGSGTCGDIYFLCHHSNTIREAGEPGRSILGRSLHIGWGSPLGSSSGHQGCRLPQSSQARSHRQ